MRYFQQRWIWAVLMLLPVVPTATADDDPIADPAGEAVENAPQDVSEIELKPFEAKMRPTEVGVRFTPRMAKAMGHFFTKEMKGRYNLDDDQVKSIEEAVSSRLMTFVYDNADLGRDLFENMFETMLENEGRFPKDSAMQFASMAKPLIPELKEFFRQTSAAIGQEMGLKQRLKFTGDVAAAMTGLAVFEARMDRWEKGQVGDNANPFYDPADHDPEAASQPVDPDEPPAYRAARSNAERQIQWRINNYGEQWKQYIERADEFYEFDEQQKNAAEAVLDDCEKRLESIKTDAWMTRVKDILIARNLTWRAGGRNFARGPWMFRLDDEYERLMKPVEDLDREFKRRIGEIPTSTQRAKSKERVRKALAENGMEKLPI